MIAGTSNSKKEEGGEDPDPEQWISFLAAAIAFLVAQ
jgi:hypothetical protein